MSELYNKRFESYYDKYKKLSDVKKYKYNKKCKPKNLKLEDYDRWFTEKELDDEEKLGNMPPRECGGEVKGEK